MTYWSNDVIGLPKPTNMAERELLSPMGDYEPPESLWKLITSYVAESEWEEVKFMLGEDLVEQSIELHQEVSMSNIDCWN